TLPGWVLATAATLGGPLALSVGGAEQVDAIAQRAGAAGILISPPRTTGDGYYEAVIADPDGNLIEIVA
ncbi:VOC family protein, partial [Klebsiella pneumoniae]|uniref:VOC family protein n=1 Tax=Klebsiella pneumoniae TaxID=573 RepID=UPI00396806AD